MENNHFKIIVVGAGPAGTSCAYVLKKNNEDCLVIDRMEFPREKLCGGGLTPKAHTLIKKIFGNFKYDYLSFKKFEIYDQNKHICDFVLNNEVRTVMRKDFDSALLDEYKKAGGLKITGTVRKIEEQYGKIIIGLSGGEKYTCDYLIGADGANSAVRKYLQSPLKKGIFLLEKAVQGNPPSDIKLHFDKMFVKGFLYRFPNPKGYVVGFGSKVTTPDMFHSLLEKYEYISEEKTKGAYIPSFDNLDYPFRKNIMLVGDAGGYVDSMTGEGIYLAVKTGENAALSIIENYNYKSLNKSVIKYVKRRQMMAKMFFSRFGYNLFIYLFKKQILHSTLTRLVNRAMSNQY